MSIVAGEQPSTSAPAAAAPSSPAPVASTPSAPASPASTPVASPPVPQAVGSQPDGQGAAAVPAADPRVEITKFAESVGLDPGILALHPNVDSARAAAIQHFENMARAGYDTSHFQQPQQPQPGQAYAPYAPAPQPAAPQPQQGASTQLDLKALGVAEDDPAAQAIRMLEQRLEQYGQTTQQIQQQMQAAQQAQERAAQSRLLAEADSVVDSFQSERYGVSNNRTIGQRAALHQLYDIADAIGRYAHHNRQPVPPVAQRLEAARLIIERQASPAAAAPAVPVLNATATSNVAPSLNGPRLNERWVDNPEFRQRLGL